MAFIIDWRVVCQNVNVGIFISEPRLLTVAYQIIKVVKEDSEVPFLIKGSIFVSNMRLRLCDDKLTLFQPPGSKPTFFIQARIYYLNR